MNKTTLINRFLIFLIIMNSGGIPFIKNLYTTFIIIMLIILNIFIQKKYDFIKPTIGLLAVSLLLLLNFVFTFDNQEIDTYVIYFLYFFIAFYFYNFYTKSKNEFFIDLEQVLKLFLYFAIYSFMMQFLVGNSLNIYSNNGYEAHTFMSLVFYPKIESNLVLLRNQGLFWEPGILQIYMNLLFFISVNIRKNKNVAILSVLIILSTFSTMGLVILSLQLIVLFYGIKDFSYIKKMIILPIAVVISIILWNVISDNFDNKFEGNDKRSSYARTYDTMTAINLIREYPFFGIGLSDNKYYGLQNNFGYFESELIKSEIENRGNTNAILKIGYQFGIPIAISILLLFYIQTVFPKNKKLFFIIMFFALLAEPLFMSPFVLIFIASGFNSIYERFHKRDYFQIRNIR